MANNSAKYRIILLILGAILVLGLVIAGTVEYTSRSAFCVNCHEMQPIYRAWQSSGHASVQCLKCHSDPGVTGLAKTKIKALGEVYRHFTNTYHQPITVDTDTAAFSARCLGCHQDIRGQGKQHNKSHFAAKMNCTDCHKGLVHNPKTNKQPPSFQVCVKCHGQEFSK